MDETFGIGANSEDFADRYLALGRADDVVRTVREATTEDFGGVAVMLCELAEKLMHSGHEPQTCVVGAGSCRLPQRCVGLRTGGDRVRRPRRSRYGPVLADPGAGAGAAQRGSAVGDPALHSLRESPDYAAERASEVLNQCRKLGIELPMTELLEVMPELDTLRR